MNSNVGPAALRTATALLIPLLLVVSQDVYPAKQSEPGVAHRGGPARDACLTRKTFSERLELASVHRSRKILGVPDGWVRQLSDLDRGARMRTLAPTSTRRFLAFTSNNALEWTRAEMAGWEGIADRLSRATQGLNVKLPRIFLVKTTGEEEFDAAYTRGHAIFLPQRFTSLPVVDPRRAFFLLAHELFHVVRPPWAPRTRRC